jgi:hypothetical protein
MKKTITILLAIVSMFGSSTVFAQDQGDVRIHKVTGSLRDVDGVAMTGAQVVFRPIDNPFLNFNSDVSSHVFATVDEQGNYSVDLLEGDYGVYFRVRSNSSNYPVYAGALPIRPDACDGDDDAREGVASYWFGGTCKYGYFYSDAKIKAFTLTSDRVLDLVLPKAVPVKVRLVTPEGNPIVGAEIQGESSSYFGDVTFGDVTTPGFLYVPMGTDTIAIPSDPYRRSFTDSNGEATFYAMPGQVNLRAGYKVGQTSVTKTFTVESNQQTQNITWNVPLREMVSTPTPTIQKSEDNKPVLTISGGNWDAGSTLTFQWFVEGTPISGANTNNFELRQNDFGRDITVQVRGTRPGYISVTKISPTFVASLKTFAKVHTPRLVGSRHVGSTLRALPGAWDTETSLSYRWFRDGQVIETPDKPTYGTSALDIGKAISVEVQASKFGHRTELRRSAEAVLPAGFKNLKFSGKFQVGNKVWIAPNRMLGSHRYTYQWFTNGVPIANAVGRSFTLDASQANAKVSAEVCAWLGAVQVQCMTQEGGSLVELGNLKQPSISISGPRKVGSELSVVLGPWADQTNVSYRWYRDGIEVLGSKGKSFSTSTLDKDKALKVQVEISKPGYAPVTLSRSVKLKP